MTCIFGAGSETSSAAGADVTRAPAPSATPGRGARAAAPSATPGRGAGTAARAQGHHRVRLRAPRPLARALENLTAELEPISMLARVQTVWERATGSTIASAASPVAEREGVLTVVCESSVWAQELEMLARELIAALNAELGCEAITKLRCRAA
jgi:predicted nucleic acid-binding Zn ribbon protein